MSEVQYRVLDTFLGVNKSETETLLTFGEASDMSNWIITDDRKLKKIYGYKSLNAKVPGQRINGMWYGPLHGEYHLIFARGGKVYKYDFNTKTEIELGTIVDAYPTTFFVTNNTVYILDGTEFYSWDGETFKVVEGYVPTVITAASPYGGGQLLESINYISGKKRARYSGDGEFTLYQLFEDDIDSVDLVTVNGQKMDEGTDYTVDLEHGQVIFGDPPPLGVNNVEITWTKNDPELRKLITNCRYYGGVFYARHWLFGNPDRRNTRFPSGVTQAGVSDPEYWPMHGDSNVGEYEITAIIKHYDKQIIFTSGDSSGATAWYSTAESYRDPGTGITTTLFPTFPINSKVGNVAPGQVQIIQNNPFTLWKGIYEWVSTYVMNEKNAQWISKRIQRDLDQVDLSKAITWDWDDAGVYLLCVGKRIWCLNYRVIGANGERGAWYILDLPHEPTCFMTIDQKLCFGTTDGQIMMFDESEATFDGEEIVAVWDMGYHNFGADWVRKYIQYMFISLLPLASTHVDIYLSTDRRATYKYIKTVSYGVAIFDNWDFERLSFETNYSPQPKKVKLRAKKIDYLKIRLVCGGTDGAVILGITLPVRAGGLVKNR